MKKIEMICSRAAALGCTEDIQIEIERNYNFFREYLEMFPDQRMVEALHTLPFSVKFLLPEWKTTQRRRTRRMFWEC